MIPGTRITLGRHHYLIPPLNFNAMELHKDFLARAMNGEIDPVEAMKTDFRTMGEIVYLAAKRNYPDLKIEALFDDLDVSNMAQAFQAVMRTSGFEEAATGETQPGEALPGVVH